MGGNSNLPSIHLKSSMRVSTLEESLASCRCKINNRSSVSRQSLKLLEGVEGTVRRASNIGRGARFFLSSKIAVGQRLGDAEIDRTERTEDSFQEDKISKSVTFSSIWIREYDVVVSDIASVSPVPALALGWDNDVNPTMNIEDYELERERFRVPMKQLKIGEQERIHILLNAGLSTKEIQKSLARSNKARNLRRKTLAKINKADKDGSLEEPDERLPILKSFKKWIRGF